MFAYYVFVFLPSLILPLIVLSPSSALHAFLSYLPLLFFFSIINLSSECSVPPSFYWSISNFIIDTALNQNIVLHNIFLSSSNPIYCLLTRAYSFAVPLPLSFSLIILSTILIFFFGF